MIIVHVQLLSQENIHYRIRKSYLLLRY